RGTAYWSNRTGASVINGAIRGLYLSEGGPDGYLGLPVGAEVRSNGVSRQEFERGTAYWSNRTGASVINGAIRSWYLAHGGPSGSLGLPVGPEIRSGGVSRQEFERGALTWSASEGVREVPASVTASAPASLAVPPVAKAEDETTASQ
ncbi:LGFP repeat-containing protein, partial [Leucobacter sp. VD1]|uniref:LGFP repeat-containing protein n=1 Tax=Leucobacter sp. VD1 TaxID=3080381 RepID=UPI003FA5366E